MCWKIMEDDDSGARIYHHKQQSQLSILIRIGSSQMKQAEYEIFVADLRKHYGLDLFSYKQNQVQRRINSYLAKKDNKSYRELFEEMRRNPNLVEEFIENITINVSNFFRNKAKWDILQKEILPEMIRKNPGKLKIWSAACSSGEEPYTLSIVLSRLLPSHQYEIIATDLDLQILAKAKKGVYPERAMIEMPSQVKRDCFDYIDGMYHIKDIYKRNVRFQKHDLLLQPYGVNYHLIICRNVMIYFTEQAKGIMYKKFSRALVQEGILFIGGSEQIISPQSFQFKVTDKFFYQKI